MMKIVLGFATVLLCCVGLAPAASAQAPGLFFTDLTVVPNSGGETVSGFSGAYVTLYGNNFGATQGSSTVSWNGLNCLRVVTWATPWLWYQKMVVQVGPSCTPSAGNLVVTTSAGASNGLPLTVNAIGSNHIYFAATTGNDSNAGTAAQPFKTMDQCKNTVNPGDICYVENGVNATGTESYSSIDLGTQCSATAPCALVAYPGASSTIGNTSNLRGLIPCGGLSGCANGIYWIVAGFTVQAQEMAVDVQEDNFRLIGNRITCPTVSNGAADGCVMIETSSFQELLGNEVFNVGAGGKLYHWMYFGADGHDGEIGWNSVHDGNPSSGDGKGGCRGIQLYNGSVGTYNINLHDNMVYNIRCDGLNPQSVDATKGFFNIYNNVVYHAGTGPDPGDLANYTCLYSGGSGTMQVYNNTFYDCGSRGGGSGAILGPGLPTVFRNNIIYATGSEPYLEGGSSSITGSNNLWFGAGNGPSQTTANVNADPMFVTAGSDFHLQSSSPAIDAGVTISSLILDIAGVSRPQGAGYDIGAYEYFKGGSSVQRPNPPTNLTVTVN